MTLNQFKKIPIYKEDDVDFEYLGIAYAKDMEGLKKFATGQDALVSKDWDWIIVTSRSEVFTFGLRFRLEIYAGRKR